MKGVLIENAVIVQGHSDNNGCREAMVRTVLPVASMIFSVLTGWETLQSTSMDIARIFVPVLGADRHRLYFQNLGFKYL
jgi:hypothetical protein